MCSVYSSAWIYSMARSCCGPQYGANLRTVTACRANRVFTLPSYLRYLARPPLLSLNYSCHQAMFSPGRPYGDELRREEIYRETPSLAAIASARGDFERSGCVRRGFAASAAAGPVPATPTRRLLTAASCPTLSRCPPRALCQATPRACAPAGSRRGRRDRLAVGGSSPPDP